MKSDAVNFLIYLIIALIIIVLAVLFYYYIVHGAISLNLTSIGYNFLNK